MYPCVSNLSAVGPPVISFSPPEHSWCGFGGSMGEKYAAYRKEMGSCLQELKAYLFLTS